MNRRTALGCIAGAAAIPVVGLPGPTGPEQMWRLRMDHGNGYQVAEGPESFIWEQLEFMRSMPKGAKLSLSMIQ